MHMEHGIYVLAMLYYNNDLIKRKLDYEKAV